jgi:hypothetical protein
MAPNRIALLATVVAVGCAAIAPAGADAGTPKMRASAGTKMSFSPAAGPAGRAFRAKVRGLRAGERFHVWESVSGKPRRVGRGRVGRRGIAVVVRGTARSARSGTRKVCVRGVRSGRTACARYRVITAPAGDDDDENAIDLPGVDDLLDEGPLDETDGPAEPGEDEEV